MTMKMALVKFAFLVAVLIGNSVALKPAVRLRVTQKGLDYGKVHCRELAAFSVRRTLLIPTNEAKYELCDTVSV